MTVGQENAMPSEDKQDIAGFWRRIFALFIDFLLLGLIGFILGLFFGDDFSKMGGWGRAIGFAIAWPYFGIMNSRLCGGQTIGKRLLKLRAVSIDGARLGSSRSLLRAAVFCLPVFLNGAAFSMAVLQGWFFHVWTILVFGVGLSSVYLYVFNRKTRQCLHDLLIGSVVVRAVAAADPVPVASMWRGHRVVVALILVTAALVPILAARLAKTDTFAGLLAMQNALASEPGVTFAGVTDGTSTFIGTNTPAQTRSYLNASVRIADKNADMEDMANHLAEIILVKYPETSSRDVVSVSLLHGFDIGIWSTWTSKDFSFSPANWRVRIAPKANAGTLVTSP